MVAVTEDGFEFGQWPGNRHYPVIPMYFNRPDINRVCLSWNSGVVQPDSR